MAARTGMLPCRRPIVMPPSFLRLPVHLPSCARELTSFPRCASRFLARPPPSWLQRQGVTTACIVELDDSSSKPREGFDHLASVTGTNARMYQVSRAFESHLTHRQ